SDIRLSGSNEFAKPQLEPLNTSSSTLGISLAELLDTPLPCCAEHEALNVNRPSASNELEVARRSTSDTPAACPHCEAAAQESSVP
ncbi:MAG: hypothetical protein ABI557_21870, partial [Aureliella sp.]